MLASIIFRICKTRKSNRFLLSLASDVDKHLKATVVPDLSCFPIYRRARGRLAPERAAIDRERNNKQNMRLRLSVFQIHKVRKRGNTFTFKCLPTPVVKQNRISGYF